MSTNRVPLGELAAAVQSAVQQTLAKHGAVPIDQIWVGFVAPEKIANSESAEAVASALSREAGVRAHGSVAQLGGAAAGTEQAHVVPHRIIGLIYEPKLLQK